MNEATENKFQFEISLSVLNHLGRNLYRNFITVLGEAISNSWDAEAENVYINIDREKKSFTVKDDGNGMSAEDFQHKFLKVGYSKRKDGSQISRVKERPYIGAKGIGKLALLSCAESVTIITKKADTEYVGGRINNTELDDAIEEELTPDQYPLGNFDITNFENEMTDHLQGTIIHFEGTKENMRNTVDYLRKLIALYFRFSLLDENFTIHVNGEPVTLDDLNSLSEKTEFLWKVNSMEDPYFEKLVNLKSDAGELNSNIGIKGFIATVEKPANLKIRGTEEKVGVDLFINGRLREKDILKHIPTARITESYIYGQIHYDEMDSDGVDRFTSSREGVKDTDGKYQELLSDLKMNIVSKVLDEWDKLRLARGQDGDDASTRKTPRQRRAISLFNMSSDDYKDSNAQSDHVDKWIKQLRPEAEFNIPAYVDCFLSENLIRKYIHHGGIPLTPPAQTEITRWRGRETARKTEANISFQIRKDNDDLSYLGMDYLAKVVEGTNKDPNTASLVRDATEYKPMRNAVGHTGLLTENSKRRLNSVYENIQGRLRTLLRGGN